MGTMFKNISWKKHGSESLAARSPADKLRQDEAFSIAKDHSDSFQCDISSLVCKLSDKKLR